MSRWRRLFHRHDPIECGCELNPEDAPRSGGIVRGGPAIGEDGCVIPVRYTYVQGPVRHAGEHGPELTGLPPGTTIRPRP